MSRSILFVAVPALFLAAGIGANCGFAQVAPAAPDRPVRPDRELTLIDDTGLGNAGLANGLVQGNFVSSSTVTVNGIRTTKINDNGRLFKFEEDPASGITCYISERYSSDDLDRIEKEQPELFMHLSAIPETIGTSTVRVSVDVETKYHAASEDELKEKHPEAHQYFEKYVKNAGENGAELHLQQLGQPLRFRVNRGGRQLIEEPDPADDDTESNETDELDDGGE